LDVGAGASPSAPDAARAAAIATVFLVALALRAIFLWQASSAPLFSHLLMDGAVYDEWAQRIAAGDWVGDGVFYQAPLYPYFLALLKFFGGDGLWPIRIVQALLGSASCVLLFLAGESFFSRKAGLIAGLGLALYPPAIFFDSLVQKASLGGFLATLLLLCIARVQAAPTPRRWLACGATLGALMATREETWLVVPVLLGWLWLRWRSEAPTVRARWSASFVGGLALLLAPIAARNAYVGGEFTLTTSQAGSNFYIGNHAGAQGVYEPLRAGRAHTPLERVDAKELAELGAGRALTPNEVSSYWFGKSFEWIRAHPGAWLALLARKAGLLLNRYEIPDYECQEYYAEHSWLLRGLGKVFHFGMLAPLAAFGLVSVWSLRGRHAVLLALLATFSVGCIAFYVFARYRYPVVPILWLYGGAIAEVKERRGIWLAAAAFGLVGLLSNRSIDLDRASQLAMTHSNAGAALADAGRCVEAEAEYRRALELEDDSDVWANLAGALTAQDRVDEALECAHKALASKPNDPQYLRVLARAQLAHGDVDDALASLQRSVDAFPSAPDGWALLGQIYASRQQWAHVLDAGRRAREHNPGDTSTSLSLAWFLATAPDATLRDPAEAVRIGEELERRTQARDFRVLDVLGVAYASAGRFAEAEARETRAADMAEASGERELAAQIRARAAAYRQASAQGR